MLYCPEHVLERLKLLNVHMVFPVIAWKFAQTLQEFDQSLVTDFLTVESTVRGIEAVQLQELQLRSSFPDSSASQRLRNSAQMDQEAFTYITAILKSIKEEANLPASQWLNARVILSCQILYASYLPVLLPTGEMDYRTHVYKCDEKCKQIVKLMEVLKEVKALGEAEKGSGYFQRRTIGRMCESIEIMGNVVAEGDMEFVKEGKWEKVTLQELIDREITTDCKTMRSWPQPQGKFTKNDDFEEAAIPLWGLIADFGLNISNLMVTTSAFIRKGDAYQALKKYRDAEDCYQSAREIFCAKTSDLRRFALLDVRLGLLYVEKGENLKAEQHFQAVSSILEEKITGEELAEAYIGIAKAAIALKHDQNARTALAKLDTFCRNNPAIPSLYSAESALILGNYYLQSNQPAQASEHLRVAVSFYSTDEDKKKRSQACCSLGDALDQLDRAQEAVYCYRIAVQDMDPADPEYARIQERIMATPRTW